MILCPQCQGALREHEPDAKWNRYFECLDCLAAFHFVRVKRTAFLERGRGRPIASAPPQKKVTIFFHIPLTPFATVDRDRPFMA